MLNGLAAAFLAAYIAAVAFRGNAQRLTGELKNETGFIKWALALFALAMIHGWAGGAAKKIIEQVAVGALVALIVSRGAKAADQIEGFF